MILIFGGLGIYFVYTMIDNHFARLEQEEWDKLTEKEKIYKTYEMVRAGEIKPQQYGEPKNQFFDYSENWCLDAMGQENWEDLGFFKGDFLDELVCREILMSAISKIENLTPEQIQNAVEEALK